MDKAQEHLVIKNKSTRDEEGNVYTETTKFDVKLYLHTVGGRFGQTGDRALRALANRIEKTLNDQAQLTSGAVAAEPEYIIDDEMGDNDET